MASAAVVSVTSTVTGSAGAWVHEFTVVNNLPNTNVVYFFGVQLPGIGSDFVATPTGFTPLASLAWNNASLGGSSTVYNINWLDEAIVGIAPGASLGGFKALDTGTTPTNSIPFYVFAFGGSYVGPECFFCGSNPGFEGVIDSTGAVPEPASWAMLIAGFGLAGAVMRRRRVPVAA